MKLFLALVLFAAADAARYTVVLRDGAAAPVLDAKIVHRLEHVLSAVVIDTDDAALLARLRNSSLVAYVEADVPMAAEAVQAAPPSWGLDRISRADLPLQQRYEYRGNGTGVTVYVVDTGVRTSHAGFGGRAAWGTNTVGGPDADCHGHGTHCAGIAAGAATGVAKDAAVVAVKALDCRGAGTSSSVVAGLEWVAQHHVPPAVASLSLSGGRSQALNDAVDALHRRGVAVVVAAGNNGGDACRFSPGSAAHAFSVGAATARDGVAAFSNAGGCVDVFAPGEAILSTWAASDTAERVLSGTSQACPHAAGVAAQLLGARPLLAVDALYTQLARTAAADRLDDARGAINLLLQAS